MADRLKTFYRFAYSSIDRDENYLVKNVFDEIFPRREVHGSMISLDFWSDGNHKNFMAKT